MDFSSPSSPPLYPSSSFLTAGNSFQLHPKGFLSPARTQALPFTLGLSAQGHTHLTWLTLLVLLELEIVVTSFKDLFFTHTPIRYTHPPGVPKTIPHLYSFIIACVTHLPQQAVSSFRAGATSHSSLQPELGMWRGLHSTCRVNKHTTIFVLSVYPL